MTFSSTTLLLLQLLMWLTYMWHFLPPINLIHLFGPLLLLKFNRPRSENCISKVVLTSDMIDSSPFRCLPYSCQIDRTSLRVRPEADLSFVPAAKAKEKAVEEAGSDS